MGSSSAPYVPPAQPDPAAVAAANNAAAVDLQQTQSDLASQTGSLARTYGAEATGALMGAPSVAYTALGQVAGVR